MTTPHFPLTPREVAQLVDVLLAADDAGNEATDAICDRMMLFLGGPDEMEDLLAGRDPRPRCRVCGEYGHSDACDPGCGKHGGSDAAGADRPKGDAANQCDQRAHPGDAPASSNTDSPHGLM